MQNLLVCVGVALVSVILSPFSVFTCTELPAVSSSFVFCDSSTDLEGMSKHKDKWLVDDSPKVDSIGEGQRGTLYQIYITFMISVLTHYNWNYNN